MSTIIAGRYDTFDDAGRASDRLRAAGFDGAAISVFFNNSPGRHATYPLGGDEFADPEAHPAGRGLGKGAAAGAAAGAVGLAGGPLVGAAAAGVGAYVGSLAGAAGESESHDDEAPKVWRRAAGVMVAVALHDASREQRALDALRDTGAQDIERADGDIRDGNWIDFDALASPQLVDEPERSAPLAEAEHRGEQR